MSLIHTDTKIENETKMVFRAMFLGIPVYSPETASVDIATSDFTVVVVRHEELAE